MGKREKNQYDYDDGRVVASMDGLESPYRSMFFPRLPKRHRERARADKKPPHAAEQLSHISKKELRRATIAAQLTALCAGLIVFAVLALFIFLFTMN